MYYQPYIASQLQPLSAQNQVAIQQAKKDFDDAGDLLPAQDEFTVIRDPPNFQSTHLYVSPSSVSSANASGTNSLSGTPSSSTPPPTTTASLSSLRTSSGVKMFANAVRPAPPRPGADLNAPLIQLTPKERDVGRLSRSGRQLSELEILQEKHEIEFKRVVPVVAQALKEVVAQHESLIRTGAQRDEKYATYETNAVPSIRIDDYVQRIAEYTYISPVTLIGSLIVLDRLSQRHPKLLFTMLNVYKLFFVAVRIGSKVVDLRTLNNKNFASVGGISNRHLNEVEARMLVDLRFDLYINPNEIVMYLQKGFGISSFIPRQLLSSPNGSNIGSPHSVGGAGGGSSSSTSLLSPTGTNSNNSAIGGTAAGRGGLVALNPGTSTTNNSRSPSQLGSRLASRRSSVGGPGGGNNAVTMPSLVNNNNNNMSGSVGSGSGTVARPPDGESPSNRPNIRRRPSSQMASSQNSGTVG